ncbi:MAG TPA: hypothetical protein VFW38_08040 [Solirubrobacteraceae bacterium]|nr:hypothetical protein [Solirubrobacteraceae bacterium]
MQTTLDKALDLLAACQNAYNKAPSNLRRQWNQALFLRLDVHDENIEHADIAEPFATLTAPDTLQALNDHTPSSGAHRRTGGTRTTTAAHNGHGSNKDQTIGETGFEPATARPPARALQCR